MSFGFRPQYKTRLYYEAGKTDVYFLPRGNLFSAINLLLMLEVNVVSSDSSNAPDFQIWNAIERMELIQDSRKAIWSLSGQAAALLFGKTRGAGVAAYANAAIAGTTANNVQGQMYLSCKSYPLDAPKPWDFLIDTRAHQYELKIKWRDLTVAGTLFGTIGSSITLTASENYMEVELDALLPMKNPADGKDDAYARGTPPVVGYIENKQAITASNTKFQVDLAEFQKYRNLIIYATHVVNTAQEVGESDILQNNIKIYDTQGVFYVDELASMVKAKTSRKWGQGSSLNAGVYDIEFTAFGSAFDALQSNNIVNLFMDLDVVKQSNNTYLRTIQVTQEAQGMPG